MDKDWIYSPDPRLESAITEIRDLYPASYPAGLSRVHHLLSKLGNPHLRLPPVFHVAGTNGKGSVLAFLQAIFEAGGLSVHKFVSPHLVQFEERIVLNGCIVAPDLLLSLIAECRAAAGSDEISFFEFFTCLGFLAFARNPADALLLETGLGGLYDATNVIPLNAVTILTRISDDHTQILGPELTDIAANKAGIIKRGCPVVIAPQPGPGVDRVFLEAVKNADAPLHPGWSAVLRADGGFDFSGAVFNGRLPPPALTGAHQVINAATAIAAVEMTEFKNLLTSSVLEQAMRCVCWPGRLQQLTQGRLAALLPPGYELWIDGAHNDSGAEALAAQIAAWGPDKPLQIIAAFKQKKDIQAFFLPLARRAAGIRIIAPPVGLPMAEAAQVAQALRAEGYAAEAADDLESALRAAAFPSQPPQRILITGSLYLAGYALKRNG